MTGRQKIDWAARSMPVLAAIKKDFNTRKPLQGLTLGVCLHLTKETAVLLETLQVGGATIFACASNPLSTQDEVVAALKKSGMNVFGKNRENMKEYKADLEKVAASNPHFIIDDGGDLTKVIHNLLIEKQMASPRGGLEETTTGINMISKMTLAYPILDVNGADTKHLFDNVYGTGQSTIDAIMRATNQLLAGKTFVVAGYGYCGKGLAQRAKGMGCNVIVTEIDSAKALQAHMDGFRVMPMKDASLIGDIFVTVTGNTKVINKDHFFKLKNGAIIANAGHFDVEIDLKFLKSKAKPEKVDHNISEYNLRGRKIFVLSEGRLVNLAAGEGHPSSVMDMSFANQALGLEWLMKNAKKLEPRVHAMPSAIDEKVAMLKLQSLGVTIDQLTPEQKKYLGR